MFGYFHVLSTITDYCDYSLLAKMQNICNIFWKVKRFGANVLDNGPELPDKNVNKPGT